MWVKATKGVRVPMDGKPRSYIEREAVEVPETAYYMRRVQEGDLKVVDAPADLNTVGQVATAEPAQTGGGAVGSSAEGDEVKPKKGAK